MELLSSEFGSFKIDTLKRRKYDVINTLEKADILVVDRSNLNDAEYVPKTEILNAKKDVEKMREEAKNKRWIIGKKKETLRMMENTRNNLKKLVEINKKR